MEISFLLLCPIKKNPNTRNLDANEIFYIISMQLAVERHRANDILGGWLFCKDYSSSSQRCNVFFLILAFDSFSAAINSETSASCWFSVDLLCVRFYRSYKSDFQYVIFSFGLFFFLLLNTNYACRIASFVSLDLLYLAYASLMLCLTLYLANCTAHDADNNRFHKSRIIFKLR